ncbi:MAG TPA: endolytic transglycosylase MltG [Solirubrobacteraceae bacterium]|nr:endolytic transglycosylase MltG [Solirubrobacteraceae bacterium]
MFARNRSQPAHERTAEERQRDREERERRRQGLPPLPDAPSVKAPPAVEEPPAVGKRPAVEEPPTIEVAPPPAQQLVAPAGAGAEVAPEVLPPPLVVEEPPMKAPSAKKSRNIPARLGALLALAAVGAAIWLLVQSLGGSSSHKPPALPRVVKVTIPEGYTRAHIAELAKDEGLKGNYLAATVRSSHLHPTRYGAPHGTPNLEGFLFPATYDLYAGAPVRRLVDEQLAAFRENFGNAEIHRAHALGVTPYQLLTVASMIEREAEVQRDRPLIAAVIYNRLRQGIPLGIDATIRYALNDFSAPLTETQLRTPSPYNTRLHHGLPPTPIANPGLASIHAAAHPAHVSYLYYVAAADGCGEHVFSSSYAQFEHDAAAYREAVAKNHGRVPTCKKR